MYHDDCTESIDSTGKRASVRACMRVCVRFFIFSCTSKIKRGGDQLG